MDADNLRRVECMYLNLSMMESDDAALVDRVEAQIAAGEEIAEAYHAAMPGDVRSQEQLDQALGYTVMFIYRTGSFAFGDDLARAFQTDLEFQQLNRRSGVWLPESQDEKALVQDLAAIGFNLALGDNNPAFKPHSSGRNFETLDPYDASYNKFGILIPGSQTLGTYV